MGKTTTTTHFETMLDKVPVSCSGAELHGTMCGALAADIFFPFERWLGEAAHLSVDKQAFLPAQVEALKSAFTALTRQLKTGDMGFQLLLPEATATYAARAAALSQWCRGFSYGISMQNAVDLDSLSNHGRSFIAQVHDLNAASRLDLSDNEHDENEQAYQQITEYITIGVLLMADEVQSKEVKT